MKASSVVQTCAIMRAFSILQQERCACTQLTMCTHVKCRWEAPLRIAWPMELRPPLVFRLSYQAREHGSIPCTVIASSGRTRCEQPLGSRQKLAGTRSGALVPIPVSRTGPAIAMTAVDDAQQTAQAAPEQNDTQATAAEQAAADASAQENQPTHAAGEVPRMSGSSLERDQQRNRCRRCSPYASTRRLASHGHTEPSSRLGANTECSRYHAAGCTCSAGQKPSNPSIAIGISVLPPQPHPKKQRLLSPPREPP